MFGFTDLRIESVVSQVVENTTIDSSSQWSSVWLSSTSSTETCRAFEAFSVERLIPSRLCSVTASVSTETESAAVIEQGAAQARITYLIIRIAPSKIWTRGKIRARHSDVVKTA